MMIGKTRCNMEDQDRYANVIFLYAVLPLLKVIIENDEVFVEYEA